MCKLKDIESVKVNKIVNQNVLNNILQYNMVMINWYEKYYDENGFLSKLEYKSNDKNYSDGLIYECSINVTNVDGIYHVETTAFTNSVKIDKSYDISGIDMCSSITNKIENITFRNIDKKITIQDGIVEMPHDYSISYIKNITITKNNCTIKINYPVINLKSNNELSNRFNLHKLDPNDYTIAKLIHHNIESIIISKNGKDYKIDINGDNIKINNEDIFKVFHRAFK